jgi:hypothetical protein
MNCAVPMNDALHIIYAENIIINNSNNHQIITSNESNNKQHTTSPAFVLASCSVLGMVSVTYFLDNCQTIYSNLPYNLLCGPDAA